MRMLRLFWLHGGLVLCFLSAQTAGLPSPRCPDREAWLPSSCFINSTILSGISSRDHQDGAP